ncbi:MAG: SUMF1/EgtB/PvdO family nonheme iron enzyme [Elusimicrobia bacterium]|nr:SUMF1/EgtB/PvdO family nonheme iron enzyme [Elusimicrobiota bacterium]
MWLRQDIPAERLLLKVQVYSGLRIDSKGRPERIPPAEWARLRARLAAVEPLPIDPSPGLTALVQGWRPVSSSPAPALPGNAVPPKIAQVPAVNPPAAVRTLHDAAAAGDVAAVRRFLAQGTPVNSKGQEEASPLHRAAGAGHVSVIDALLSAGADVDPQDLAGATPLHYAARSGKDEACRRLLSRGAKVESGTKRGETPLMWAAESGHTTVMEFLLANGADPASRDELAQTPLHKAVAQGRTRAIELLLSEGVDVEAVDKSGAAPLLTASLWNQPLAAGILLKAGAKPSSSNNGIVGLSLQESSGTIRVVEAFLGMPAEKAGIKAGDLIIAVDDQSTEGLSLSDVCRLLRGPPGQKVAVAVHRPGISPKQWFTVVRQAAVSFSATPASASVAADKAGVKWVHIPGGSFMMGSDSGPPEERPAHRVSVGFFEMAKTEVTNKQYRACVAAGACTPAGSQSRCKSASSVDDQPVVCVDWNQAASFAMWVGGRLPSETEWEYAARSAGEDWRYPWGNEVPTCDRAAMNNDSRGCGRNETWPVCSKTAGNTQQGLCDMVGNVWEWTQDWYHDSYEGAPTDGSLWESPESPARVCRSGSWDGDATRMRATTRSKKAPGFGDSHIGIRVAR